MKKTKIICSIGPSTQVWENFKGIVEAGMNVARINFSHATMEERALDESLIKRANEELFTKSIHGTTNALIENMIIGVSKGYTVELETVGVGYRFQVTGKQINVSAGFSHPVVVDIPEGITVEAPSTTELKLSGIDKQKVTEFAANIRKIRKPEPYKGKGIRYKGEVIRRKEGKKASK